MCLLLSLKCGIVPTMAAKEKKNTTYKINISLSMNRKIKNGSNGGGVREYEHREKYTPRTTENWSQNNSSATA